MLPLRENDFLSAARIGKFPRLLARSEHTSARDRLARNFFAALCGRVFSVGVFRVNNSSLVSVSGEMRFTVSDCEPDPASGERGGKPWPPAAVPAWLYMCIWCNLDSSHGNYALLDHPLTPSAACVPRSTFGRSRGPPKINEGESSFGIPRDSRQLYPPRIESSIDPPPEIIIHVGVLAGRSAPVGLDQLATNVGYSEHRQ